MRDFSICQQCYKRFDYEVGQGSGEHCHECLSKLYKGDEIETLKNEVLELEDEKKTLTYEVIDLREAVDTLDTKLETKDQVIRTLSTQLDKLQHNFELLKIDFDTHSFEVNRMISSTGRSARTAAAKLGIIPNEEDAIDIITGKRFGNE